MISECLIYLIKSRNRGGFVLYMPTTMAPLLTWINFNHGIETKPHAQYIVGWNYLFILKLQRF